MEDLRIAACLEGRPQWGGKGPQDAGCYNSSPLGVPFFEGGQRSFLSDYGHFFLVCTSPERLSPFIYVNIFHGESLLHSQTVVFVLHDVRA